MEIVVHEGRRYQAVERHAKEGDKFVVYRATSPYLTKGKVYAITYFDSASDPQVIDNEGDEYDLSDTDNYLVLEPLASEPITLISVVPPVEKSYTLAITDGVLAKIETALATAGFEDIRETIAGIRNQ